MMDLLPDFGKNAAYIWACYGIGLVLIGGTVIGVLFRARNAKHRLARLKGDDGDIT
ncbi:MAG: heme exporter protein CcmD [Hyphomonas sp.]